MESRNITNSLGSVIGVLTLPDSTPEDTWQKLLTPYKDLPLDIEKVRTAKLLKLDVDARDYLLSRYIVQKQFVLDSIRLDAFIANKTSCITYLNNFNNWRNSVISYYLSKQVEINAANTLSALDSIGWDFNTKTASDPNTSLQTAFDLLNS